MEELSYEELCQRIKEDNRGRIDFSNRLLRDMDLTGMNLQDVIFDLCDFKHVKLERANLQSSSFINALLDGESMAGSDLRGANLQGICLREGSLEHCDCRGVNFYSAVLEHTNRNGIIVDNTTKWYNMYCPETGPILGFKKCFDNRLVQLLIPADAKRTSATRPSCRCNKAKVLSIWDFDATHSYEEAWSLVDDNFVYRKGQWVEVKNFNEDRWFDSTTGIHFWLTREEAINY